MRASFLAFLLIRYIYILQSYIHDPKQSSLIEMVEYV